MIKYSYIIDRAWKSLKLQFETKHLNLSFTRPSKRAYYIYKTTANPHLPQIYHTMDF
jgi:hypothetical protein